MATEMRKRGRPPLGDRKKPAPMRAIVSMPKEMHARLQAYCSQHKLTPDMGSVIRLAICEFLSREEQAEKQGC